MSRKSRVVALFLSGGLAAQVWAPRLVPMVAPHQPMVMHEGTDQAILLSYDYSDSLTFSHRGGGWVPQQVTSPVGYRAQMAYDPRTDRLVLYSDWMRQTWSFDGARWRPLPMRVSPPRGEDFVLAYLPALRGVVWVGAPEGHAEAWVLDGPTWRKVAQGGPALGTGFAAAYVASAARLAVFGGGTPRGALDTTWWFDGARWTAAQFATRHVQHAPFAEQKSHPAPSIRARIEGWPQNHGCLKRKSRASQSAPA